MKGSDIMKRIITISRECGSGGHIIAEKLSKELGIPLYDREIIEMTAKKSGLTTDFVQESNERITNSILFNIANSMTYANQVFTSGNVSMVDQVFFIQCDIIKKVANDSPCIIVGRCADYILRERDDCLNVFVHADKEYRKERFAKLNNISEKEAESVIKKRDKSRQNYYRYYTDKEWGNMKNYALALDSKVLGNDMCAELILKAYKEL